MKCNSFSQHIRQSFENHEVAKILQHHFGGNDYTDKQIQIFLKGVEAGAHASFHSLTTAYAALAGTLSAVHSALSTAIPDAAKLGRKQDYDILKEAVEMIDRCYTAHVAQNTAIYTIEIERDWRCPSKFFTGKRLNPTNLEA